MVSREVELGGRCTELTRALEPGRGSVMVRVGLGDGPDRAGCWSGRGWVMVGTGLGDGRDGAG